tara:strand:+ start:5270 stop:5548 length:279 start_codon:yes stop_codon:yes gene_type:complete
MIMINGVECNTQTEVVLQHLKKGKQINQEQAYELCGSQRLGAIIFNLRKKGYAIHNLDSKGKNRFGNTCNYVNYMLVNTQEQITRIETNGQA